MFPGCYGWILVHFPWSIGLSSSQSDTSLVGMGALALPLKLLFHRLGVGQGHVFVTHVACHGVVSVGTCYAVGAGGGVGPNPDVVAGGGMAPCHATDAG